jgi:hypothetical protein
MTPAPWAAAILALGVFRVVRLIGWDVFPVVARVRAWAVGETIRYNVAENRDNAIYAYRRPTLNYFINCPFCMGFWLSLAIYGLWRWQPDYTVAALFPLALSAAVGLIGKNLDA